MVTALPYEERNSDEISKVKFILNEVFVAWFILNEVFVAWLQEHRVIDQKV
jgi:hypothetical protein